MGFTKVSDTNNARPEGRNCVLIYGYNEEALCELDRVRVRTGIDEIVTIETNQLGNTLNAILTNEMIEKTYEKVIADPIMVFHAVSDVELNTFLNEYRTLKLKKALVAVVTKTSIKWRFGDLAVELSRERRAMKNRK